MNSGSERACASLDGSEQEDDEEWSYWRSSDPESDSWYDWDAEGEYEKWQTLLLY